MDYKGTNSDYDKDIEDEEYTDKEDDLNNDD